jgi:hypothetical protein
MKMGIPIAPSLNDPKVATEVSDIIDKRNQADYNCYLILRDLIQTNFENDDDLFARARQIIKTREDLNDRFLMKLSGNG